MKLNAENEIERRVLEYVLANASPDLMQRIDAEGKTIQKCWAYVTSYARKHAKGLQYCMTDQEAFGLVMHYFEDETEGATYGNEEEMKGEAKSKPENELRETEPKPEAIRKEKATEGAAREQAKRERAEARRKATKNRESAEQMQLTLFDGI